MEELFFSLPHGALIFYFISNLLFRSFLIQKTLPEDLSPNWINKNVAFFLMIFNELTFLYWAYSLYAVPNIKIWQMVIGLLLLRWFVNWSAKLRALGVYFGYLKNKMKSFSESSDEYQQIQNDINTISSNPKGFWEECKKAKWWRNR